MGLAEWIKSIAVTAVICSVAELLIPDSCSLKGTVKSVSEIILLICMAKPAIELIIGS